MRLVISSSSDVFGVLKPFWFLQEVPSLCRIIHPFVESLDERVIIWRVAVPGFVAKGHGEDPAFM